MIYFSFLSGTIDTRQELSSLDMNVVIDGNSLVRSFTGTNIEQYWPNNLRDWLNPQCNSLTFNSFGVGGQTMQQMIDDADSQIGVNGTDVGTPTYSTNIPT